MPPVIYIDLALGLICLSLLCAPAVAVGLYAGLRRVWPWVERRSALVCAGLVAAAALAVLLPLHLTPHFANALALIAAYLTYCLLAVHGWLMQPLS